MRDPKKEARPEQWRPGDQKSDVMVDRPDEAGYPVPRSETPGDGNPGTERRENEGRDRPETSDE